MAHPTDAPSLDLVTPPSDEAEDPSEESGWPSYVPGKVFYAVTILGVIVALDWTSQPGWNFGGLGLVGVSLSLIGLLGGLVWTSLFFLAAVETRLRMSRRAWARWFSAPAIALTCVALIVSGLPTTVRFDLSKPALEQAVRTYDGERVDAGWVGLFDMADVGKGPTNATLFNDN
jgi:hypothetical protein